MRAGFPVHAIVNMPHDDQLFIRLALYLRAGAWLGPYNNLTLAKGMFFPLFIATARSARIPLKIAEQIVYLGASSAAAGVVRKQATSNRLGLVLFALLAFNPVLWNVDLARVLRDGLYVGLSLAVVAMAAIIVFPSHEISPFSIRTILQGVGFGFLCASFYLTREEGIWLAPALAVMIAVALIGIWRSGRPPSADLVVRNRFAQLMAIAVPMALALVTFIAADGLVATLNYRHYGVFVTNELKTESFRRAFGAITRVREDQWHPHILFPHDARQRAYAVSPAALRAGRPP